MMWLYAVYQVNTGGSTGATQPDTYKLKGIFLDGERAMDEASSLIRDHKYYSELVQEVYVPDEAIGMMFKAAIEGMQNDG